MSDPQPARSARPRRHHAARPRVLLGAVLVIGVLIGSSGGMAEAGADTDQPATSVPPATTPSTSSTTTGVIASTQAPSATPPATTTTTPTTTSTTEPRPAPGLLAPAQARAAAATCPVQKPATRVMAPTRTTGAEMAAWFTAKGKVSKATVPISTLASYYAAEAADEGVDGSWAFAQAMFETGWLTFSSYVPASLNNFAGLGAGGGATPRSWPTAQLGVRAHIQHLRAYADPTATVGRLHHPLADPGFANIVPKGRWPYWEQYGNGVWAGGSCYYDLIASIRGNLRSWVLAHRRWAPFRTVEGLVTYGYREQMLREPTASEVQAGVAALTSGRAAPVDLLTVLATGAAVDTRPVVRAYLTVLGRPPSAAYLRRRVADRRRGQYVASLATELLASAEFREANPGITTAQLVDLVYLRATHRLPSDATRASWVARIADRRATRGDLVRSVSESAVAVGVLGPWVQTAVADLPMVGYAPSPTTIAWWRNRLAAGAGLSELVAHLFGSAPYVRRFS